MHLPKFVTQEVLNQLAAPTDRVMVRVVLRRIGNTAPYTVWGKKRRYVFRRDPELGAHVLDVPMSVWMWGFPDGPYRDNLSIAHDLQGNRAAVKAPLVFLVIESGAVADAEAPQAGEASHESLLAFRELLVAMEAPELVLQAFDTLSSELPAERIEETIRETIRRVTAAEEPTSPDPAEPVVREGDAFYKGGEKIGLINAAGILQMSKGKADLRPEVEALLEKP